MGGDQLLAREPYPPAPNPKASWCFSTDGRRVTSVVILVGQVETSFNTQQKSSGAWWTPLFRATHHLVLLVRAYCMWLNRPLPHSSGIDMERSSPSTLCHFLTLVLLCVVGILARIPARYSSWCGGRWGGHSHYIDHPSQDKLDCTPRTITLEKLLQGYGLPMEDAVRLMWRPENNLNSMHLYSFHMASTCVPLW